MPDSSSHDQETTERIGVAAALAAYIYWGLAPIYFKWIQDVPPLEVIAHRIFWSIPVLVGFLLWRDGTDFYKRMRLPWKTVALLGLSGSLVAGNWLIFVYAVANQQVMSTSLGYFIGPLVNFLLGFLFLKERLTPIQTVAVVIAAAGTAYLGWYLGSPPWIALGLAFTFGTYGLVRKLLPVGPMIGLLWETLLLSLPAAWLAHYLVTSGNLYYGTGTTTVDVLLLLAGLITVLPLIWFNVAARTLSLTTLGFFQYLAPILSFLLSVFLFKEAFTRGHAVAFGCIWVALIMVTAESVVRVRRNRIP